jgi:hypothetical protein
MLLLGLAGGYSRAGHPWRGLLIRPRLTPHCNPAPYPWNRGYVRPGTPRAPAVIVDGMIHENPYYIEPGAFLSRTV